MKPKELLTITKKDKISSNPIEGVLNKKRSTGKPKELDYEEFEIALTFLILHKDGTLKDLENILKFVKKYFFKLLTQQKTELLKEIKGIVDKGVPIFFKVGEDLSEDSPQYKAICYYLNQLRNQIKEEINNLNNK